MTTSPDQNYTSWHCGMRVVCVDGRPHLSIKAAAVPHRGEVYTIRAMTVNPKTGRLNIRLCEIVNLKVEAREGYEEPYFGASRFRPVQTRKTDISVFQAMLSPKPAKAGKVRA